MLNSCEGFSPSNLLLHQWMQVPSSQDKTGGNLNIPVWETLCVFLSCRYTVSFSKLMYLMFKRRCIKGGGNGKKLHHSNSKSSWAEVKLAVSLSQDFFGPYSSWGVLSLWCLCDIVDWIYLLSLRDREFSCFKLH